MGYMNHSTQCIRINGFTSKESKLSCGTAQGSILGPLFFILFVNDIFAYVDSNKSLTMYADDTLLIEQGDSSLASVFACQQRLDEVERWCKHNKLCINIDKTKSMMVYSGNIGVHPETLLEISGRWLQHVSKYEYLGVIMDDILDMNNHIEHITKKVQVKLSILRKIRRHITENSAMRIFKGLIMCHFDYGDFVIDSGTRVNIDKLDRLFVRALRCIEYRLDAAKRSELPVLCHRYNLESLETRRKRNLLEIMYKESKEKSNIDIYRPKRVLRSNANVKLHHKFTKLSKIQKSPYYRGLDLWDKLPPVLLNIGTKLEF